MSAVEDLTYQGFARVGPEQWKNNIKHVETKVEDHFWITRKRSTYKNLSLRLAWSWTHGMRKAETVMNLKIV